jgi:pimeloyl-ACP methyl ester carboxylesterase
MVKKVLGIAASLVAVGLLVVPFLIPVETTGTMTKEQAAESVWGDKSNWIELAGHEVHYVIAGDPDSDRLIVLLHGFGASAYSYTEVLQPLSAMGQVIAYDRAAFGFTERPTEWDDQNPYGIQGQIEVLDEVIKEFGDGKEVYLLGHSAGGSIAASYAQANPEMLDGLILFAPAVLTAGGAPSWLNWIFDIPQLDHLGPLLVSTIATSGLDLLYQSYFDQNKLTQETLDAYTAPLKIAGWENAFWEFNKAPRDSQVGERLGEINVPTLVIAGDADTVVPTADSIKVSGLIPYAKLVLIPKTGHLPNEESPKEFADAVVSFIRDR